MSAELAVRECATGMKVFEACYSKKCVEVILASLATERLARRVCSISARR